MDINTGKESIDSDKIFEKFKNEPAFVQSIKAMKATTDYIKNKNVENLDNWKTYYTSRNPKLHLIGDNPLILRNSSVNSIYKSELIYPLSKDILILNSKGKTLKTISPENRVKIDMLVFLQSQKYVCGPDFEYLKIIASLCIKKGYDNPRNFELLKEEVFLMFE